MQRLNYRNAHNYHLIIIFSFLEGIFNTPLKSEVEIMREMPDEFFFRVGNVILSLLEAANRFHDTHRLKIEEPKTGTTTLTFDHKIPKLINSIFVS